MNAALICLALIAPGQWQAQEGGTGARLRGVSVVDRDVAWASGNDGTCLRTADGGTTWKLLSVSDATTLDFRDVQAVDAGTAYLLSIGPGPLSRIYKTGDAGSTWTLSHQNRDPAGFLDAIAFWDADHGLALGDPVGGRFVILATDDGGRTWEPAPAAGMPEALRGEGAFAASGTCLVVQGGRQAWFATGGGATARVFRSSDRGRTWAVADTPIRAGNPSSGVFALAFRDPDHGVAVGGDHKRPDEPGDHIATTDDGGRTWTPAARSSRSGFRSAVAFVPGHGPAAATLLAVGPSGWDTSTDGGRTWGRSGAEGFHALGFAAAAEAGWAVGEKGRIARFEPGSLRPR